MQIGTDLTQESAGATGGIAVSVRPRNTFLRADEGRSREYWILYAHEFESIAGKDIFELASPLFIRQGPLLVRESRYLALATRVMSRPVRPVGDYRFLDVRIGLRVLNNAARYPIVFEMQKLGSLLWFAEGRIATLSQYCKSDPPAQRVDFVPRLRHRSKLAMYPKAGLTVNPETIISYRDWCSILPEAQHDAAVQMANLWQLDQTVERICGLLCNAEVNAETGRLEIDTWNPERLALNFRGFMTTTCLIWAPGHLWRKSWR